MITEFMKMNMLQCLYHSFSTSFVTPCELSDLNKYNIVHFLLPDLFICLLTPPTIMSKLGYMYPLARLFFIPS